MILFPPSKVNIGLNILGKRNDGYHDIESVMLELPLCDILEILPWNENEFVSSGKLIDGNEDENLCLKAYRLMQDAFDLPPVFIHLHKIIPMGAGLGGGSSDAAYVILGLNKLFNLDLSTSEMEKFAAEIGSDCAFFIRGKTQFAKGRGEELNPIELSHHGNWVKLINPGIHVSTAEAYRNVVFSGKDELEKNMALPYEQWINVVHNGFEPSIFAKHPQLKEIKQMLLNEGARYASMSGSGSTMYGFFDSEPEKTKGYDQQWILRINA